MRVNKKVASRRRKAKGGVCGLQTVVESETVLSKIETDRSDAHVPYRTGRVAHDTAA